MVRLALIGRGRWGTTIAQTLRAIRSAKLVAVSRSPRQSKSLLARDDLTGVIIATPAASHAAVAVPFIRRGLPVFIEKPLATNHRDAERLARESRRAGSFIFIGHIHLYNPAYEVARAYAQRAGRLRWLAFESGNLGPFRTDVSALWDWAPHDVALALDLAGSMPRSVSAWAGAVRHGIRSPEWTTIRLTFPNELIATVTVSWLGPAKRKCLTAYGERATVVFDDTAPERRLAAGNAAGKVTVYRRIYRQARRGRPPVLTPPYRATPPLLRELRAFVRSVRTGEPPRTDIRQGVAVVRVLEAAERSRHLDGRPLRV